MAIAGVDKANSVLACQDVCAHYPFYASDLLGSCQQRVTVQVELSWVAA